MVTTAQLHAAGCDTNAIAYRARIGRLHPVFRGVYSLGGPPQTDKELWMAATLTYGKGTLLSHSAAVDLYGWLRYPLGGLHVTTPKKRPSRQGITAHHRQARGRWKFIDHIPVTGPAQTVLDAATAVTSDKAYRRIVRQAQVKDTTHAHLLALGALRRGAPGVGRLKRELAKGPSRTRSANEDEVLEVFRRGGEPIPNTILFGYEVDLWFPKLHTAIEVQSALHDNPTARADDEAKRQRLAEQGVRVLWIS